MFILKGKKADLQHAVFSPDGRWLASCGLRTPIDIWDIAGRRHAREIRCGTINRALSFTHDGGGLLVLADDAGLAHFGVADGVLIATLPGAEDAYAAAFSGDARQACLCYTDADACRQVLRQHHMPDGGLGWSAPLPDDHVGDAAMASSRDGRVLAIGRYNGSVHWFDAATGTHLGGLPAGKSMVRSISLSPDGSVAAWCAASRLHVWRLGPPAQVAEHNLGRTHFLGVAWHPSGRFFATANGDGKIDFWDAVTAERRESFDWGLGKVFGVTFDTTGERAAACGRGGQVVVWDVDR